MRSNDEIVDILNSLKDQKGLSLSELARRVGMAKSALSRYFNKTRQFPLNKVQDFAEVLGVSSEYILGFDVENTCKNDITSIYNKLETPRQKIVYHTAEKQLKEQTSNIIRFPSKSTNELQLYSERKAKAQALVDIDLLGGISAGTGEFAIDEHAEKISLPESIVPPSADFCLIVNGDSMEPVILDGSYVFIDKTNEIPSGTISAVIVNGEAFIKRVWFENGHARLESFNDKYDDIIVTKEDDFHIIGKVVM